ncbi:MAG: copper amine oxidase N-terminal domain-containing protein [Clostridiales bacterium]|nr:copper amine oxidase N-terminal domain-containing protein [Clostridiales bacterium]
MKKVISLIMAAVMLFSIPVHASSYASLNKVKTVRDEVMISDQYLKITPRDEVETGSSIIISFTNAKITTQTQIDGMYQYSDYEWKGASEGFWDVMPKIKTNELPYKIRRVGNREIQVYLINLPRRYTNSSLYSVNGSSGRPVYNIRLPIISDGAGNIQIKINNNDSTISSATLTGNYVWTKYGEQAVSGGLSDTEGPDGEILEAATEETTTETTTQAASSSASGGGSSEGDSEEEEDEIDIFEMDYNELIAVRDLSDIIAEEDELSYVDWDSNTKTVTISFKDNILQFISDSDYYILNDEIIYFDDAAVEDGEEEAEGGGLVTIATIIDRRMYVPVGVVIETLGLEPEKEETTETTTEETTEETTETAETEEEAAEETTEEVLEA